MRPILLSLLLASTLCATAAPATADAEPSPSPSPSPVTGDGSFGGDMGGTADVEQGVIHVEVDAVTPGTDGSPGSPAPEVEGPPSVWISWWILDTNQDPACLRRTGRRLTGDDVDRAAAIQREESMAAIAEAELYRGPQESVPLCPQPDGTPGIDPTPAQDFADSASERLPDLAVSISGDYAITGLRSWLDLGRPSTFRAEKDLDLGPYSRTAIMTATATTTVDWGDGTVTTHTSPGGGYHDGEPGPDDIVHTYIDPADNVTLTVTDTWSITVTIPNSTIADITLTWTNTDRLDFPVREVRSARDR